jgi:EAL domain-containing protein (putative c-di-GMP-specific phosphodiesterase class I)
MTMRLLVLDDDPRMCDYLAAVGRRVGWQVATATEPATFARLLPTCRPDAVFLDLRLGGTDGIEVLRSLAAKSYPGSVVLLSGFNDRVLDAARAIGAGFGLRIVDALEKPVRAATVRDELGRLGPAPEASVPPRRALETGDIDLSDIARARAAGEMVLHYQPIVATRDRALVGVEALLRWNHPARGYIPPDAFIAVVEEDGAAMDALTTWTIEQALAARKHMDRAGLRVPIGVNISGLCLRHMDFPDIVARLVTEAGHTPSALSLEITESIAMVGSAQTADILTRLRLRGFDVAIDDLGAGFASLQALLNVPFSYVKIDRSFIAGITTSRDSLSIVRAIAEMARNMRMRSVAEGVETEEVAGILRDLGIDALQGALLSMPLALEALITWARARAVAVPPVARVGQPDLV